jgi:hypothetical protein
MGGVTTSSPANVAPTNFTTICISTSTTVFDGNYQIAVHNSTSNIGSTPALQVVRFVSNTSATSYHMLMSVGKASNLTGIKLEAVRIA